jgi:hypothetical protein
MAITFTPRRRLLIAGGVVTALVSFGSAASAGAAPKDTTASKAGKACTVSSGSNAGKSGTYTVEEGTGSLWCEGSWGGTECAGSDKCKDAARIVVRVPAPVFGNMVPILG